MQRLRAFIAVPFAGALVLSLVGCACPKVYRPASDSTPPTLEWKVTNNATSAVQNFSGNGSLTAKWGETYSVKLTATDGEGVHQVELADSVGWSCKSGNITKSSGPGLASPQVNTKDVWPSGQVCSELTLFRDLDFHFECQSGFQFASGSGGLTGTARNFFGGVTTGTLSIGVVP